MSNIGKIKKLKTASDDTEYTYIWHVKNYLDLYFSNRGTVSYESDPIFIGLNNEYQWTLHLYINGFRKFSQYLCVAINLKDKGLHEYAKFTVEICILDRNDQKHFIRKVTLTHENINKSGGLIEDFVLRNELLEKGRLLLNNGLRISCKICMNEPKIFGKTVNLQTTQETSSRTLEKLWEDKRFSDFKLTVGKKEFCVHRAILAAESPVFRAMFESNMREAKEGKADIEDVDPKIMEKTLHFIYDKKSNDIEYLTDKVLVVAEKYQIDSLKQFCENVLVKQLTLDNVYDTLVLADQNNAEELKNQAIDFFLKNAKKLFNKSFNIKECISTLPTNLQTEIICTFMAR